MATHADNRRIDHGAFDFADQLCIFFNIGRKPLQNGVEHAAEFAGGTQVHIKIIKNLGMFFQRFGKCRPAFHICFDFCDYFFECGIFRLACKNFKTLDAAEAPNRSWLKTAG